MNPKFQMRPESVPNIERILLAGLMILGVDLLVLACCAASGSECSFLETAAKLIIIPVMIVLIYVVAEICERRDVESGKKTPQERNPWVFVNTAASQMNFSQINFSQIKEKINEYTCDCPTPMRNQLRQLEDLEEASQVLLSRRFGGTAVTEPAFAAVVEEGKKAVLRNVDAASIYLSKGEKTNRHVEKLVEANDKVLEQMNSLVDSLRSDEVNVCVKRSEAAALQLEETIVKLKKYPLRSEKKAVDDEIPFCPQ